MALVLSPFSQQSVFRCLTELLDSSFTLKIYPSTVSVPGTIPGGAGPAGNILLYSGMNFNKTGTLVSLTSGTTNSNATAAGTLSWWFLYSSTNSIFSDSIGLSGQGKIITVNTMTPTNGQSVSIAFNLSLVQ